MPLARLVVWFRTCVRRLAGLLFALALVQMPACAATPSSSQQQAAIEALKRANAAMVGVDVIAVEGSRSAETLGRARSGSGVVIGPDGLVLTIGYLIVEAEDVSVVDSKGRTLSARVVGYDHATGFGLVRTIVPLGAAPVSLGESGKVSPRDPVMIASSGNDTISFAYVVSKRAFSGNWDAVWIL